MKKTILLCFLCFVFLLASCSEGSVESGGILADPPQNELPSIGENADQDAPGEDDKSDILPEDGEDEEQEEQPEEDEGEPPTSQSDTYVYQSEWGEEILTLDFDSGIYTLMVNTIYSGIYTASLNVVTLPLFDAQNVWTVKSDGSMTLGGSGEAESACPIGTFYGESAYGEYTLTLSEDGTFVFTQNELSSGSYHIVDGYTIIKREQYGEENLYAIADIESKTFYYSE